MLLHFLNNWITILLVGSLLYFLVNWSNHLRLGGASTCETIVVLLEKGILWIKLLIFERLSYLAKVSNERLMSYRIIIINLSVTYNLALNFSQNCNKKLWDVLIVYLLFHTVPESHDTPTQALTAKLCTEVQEYLPSLLGRTWNIYFWILKHWSLNHSNEFSFNRKNSPWTECKAERITCGEITCYQDLLL